MPYKEKPVQKKYYSVQEVADMFDMAPSALRFWERSFKKLSPKRNTNTNRRMYTASDISVVEEIWHLVRVKGYTIEGANKQLKDYKYRENVKGYEDLLLVAYLAHGGKIERLVSLLQEKGIEFPIKVPDSMDFENFKSFSQRLNQYITP